MTQEEQRLAQWSLPALLRGARAPFTSAVREALSDAGFDDMPGNGSYVVGAIARSGATLSRIITELGVSKQSAGQLIDTLVTRGYLVRSADPADRRRLTVSLTERGLAAAAVVRLAVDRVDALLAEQVGTEQVARTRATLGALIEIQRRNEAGNVD